MTNPTINPCNFCKAQGGKTLDPIDCPKTSCPKHIEAVQAKIAEQDVQLSKAKEELTPLGVFPVLSTKRA